MSMLISIDPTQDNAVAINAALNDPTRSIVVVGPGSGFTDTPIVVPSGKKLMGSGCGVTILTRRNANQDGDYGPSLIRTQDGSTGIVISDLTLIAPKTETKVQGVWVRATTNFVVERVETFNMGYAFFAQEFAQYGVFRQLRSYNANVHFETTQAYNILFDDILSGDGDGDNPLGFEAVWHCLLASRDITFRHARHRGSGSPFLIVANDINGDPLGGLIDNITFEDCQAVSTDGAIGMLITNYNNLPVGNVVMVDCGVDYENAAHGNLLGSVQVGNLRMRGGTWRSYSQENFIVYAGATLEAVDVNVDVTTAAFGNVYNAYGNTRVIGGTLTLRTTTMVAGVFSTGTLYISPTTKIVTPNVLYGPDAPFQVLEYVYKSDVTANGSTLGAGTSSPQLVFNSQQGAEYRVRLAGKVRKESSSGNIYLYLPSSVGALSASGYGAIRMQLANGTYQGDFISTGAISANSGDIRMFDVDLTFIGTGNAFSLTFSGTTGGATMLAGAHLSIERLN